MPRIHEGVRTEEQDERAEIILEPDQVVDLLQHWRAVPLHRDSSGNDERRRYQYAGDGALCITRIATTSPDVFVSFYQDAGHQTFVVGGPWLVGTGSEQTWIVPVRRCFSLTAANRSRETVRATIYAHVVARSRVGWQ